MPRPGVPLCTKKKNNLDWGRAMRKAIKELSMDSAHSQVQTTLRKRQKSDVIKTGNIPLGSLRIVFCALPESWDGPYHVVDIRGDTVTLLCTSTVW